MPVNLGIVAAELRMLADCLDPQGFTETLRPADDMTQDMIDDALRNAGHLVRGL